MKFVNAALAIKNKVCLQRLAFFATAALTAVCLAMGCTSVREPYALYVAEKKGTDVFAAPDLHSKKVMRLPYREGVVVFHEEDAYLTVRGKEARWLRVFLQGKEGYALSVFFTPHRPQGAPPPAPVPKDSSETEPPAAP